MATALEIEFWIRNNTEGIIPAELLLRHQEKFWLLVLCTWPTSPPPAWRCLRGPPYPQCSEFPSNTSWWESIFICLWSIWRLKTGVLWIKGIISNQHPLHLPRPHLSLTFCVSLCLSLSPFLPPSSNDYLLACMSKLHAIWKKQPSHAAQQATLLDSDPLVLYREVREAAEFRSNLMQLLAIPLMASRLQRLLTRFPSLTGLCVPGTWYCNDACASDPPPPHAICTPMALRSSFCHVFRDCEEQLLY